MIASAGPEAAGQPDAGAVPGGARRGQLRGIYEEVAQSLRDSYSLSYRTGRKLPDGTLRPVQVYYGGSTEAAGETEVFIPGMVVPAAGWSRMFLGLCGVIGGLALIPGLVRRRGLGRGETGS